MLSASLYCWLEEETPHDMMAWLLQLLLLVLPLPPGCGIGRLFPFF